MSLFDRWNRPSPSRAEPISRPDGLGVERAAGHLAVTLVGLDDPFHSDVVNGHCTEDYKLGRERLVTLEVLVRNDSTTEVSSVSGSKLHLFDDAHYLREPLALDSRARKPALVETLLPPGATVRGWVTYVLPWERQPARAQFFSGYLSAKVAVFHLPVRDAAEHARRHDEAQRARDEAASARQRAAEEESRVRQLEARARQLEADLARMEAQRARYATAQRPPPDVPDDDEG